MKELLKKGRKKFETFGEEMKKKRGKKRYGKKKEEKVD